LLYGPPGCGKTFFAEKLAEEIGCNYMYAKCSDVASPYIHGGQEKIAALFEEARKNAPTLLFLDEVEAMIMDRSKQNNSSMSGEVNEFLAQLNNCGEDRVTVIAATNKPDLIDEAALRSGRLALHYYIPQPNYETRRQLFKVNLKKRSAAENIDYDKLASMTENYSCADIKEIVDNAGRYAFGNDCECITQEMLETAAVNLTSHLSMEVIRKHEAIRDRFESQDKKQEWAPIGFRK
jgi:transitional endoplasmic reticulum ATPase